jgi:UDP-sugar pyrophosphorylase
MSCVLTSFHLLPVLSTKVGLPVEMATESLYLKYYIQYILAVQKNYAPKGKKLPLCIMTSGDTNERTVKLLEKHKYFGMDKDQITIVIQGKGVPALLDNHAKIATDPDSPTSILTKPHGHGDIHALLYSNSVAKKWLADGVEWLVLFQDTNGLAFHTLPLMLGVSTKLDLIMNSLAVPRKAKQAIGGIAKLTNKKSGENK